MQLDSSHSKLDRAHLLLACFYWSHNTRIGCAFSSNRIPSISSVELVARAFLAMSSACHKLFRNI